MRFTCLQENLNKGLNIVKRAVPAKLKFPITGNVLLEAGDNQLKMVCTDSESLTIMCWIDIQTGEKGSTTVPARKVSDFVATLPTDMISAFIEDNMFHMDCSGRRANVGTVKASEFPTMPTMDNHIVIKVDPEELKQSIRQVIFSAAVEASRPMLTGVCFTFDRNNLTLAGADGMRLAIKKMTFKGKPISNTRIVVPAKILSDIMNTISDTDPIEIRVDSDMKKIQFKMKSIEIIASLLQGDFPKYDHLIPTKFVTTVTTNVPEFSGMIKSAAVFNEEGNDIIKLIIEDSKINVLSYASQRGDSTGIVKAVIKGPNIKTAFSSKFLTEVLSVLKGPDMTLEMINSSKSVTIKSEDQNYVYIVMPLLISW
jgi:DNA polymerase-3 subunit beta